MLTPLILFLNYKAVLKFISTTITEDNIEQGAPLVLFFSVEIVLILIFIVPLIFGEDGLLNKFNNWLDEKF